MEEQDLSPHVFAEFKLGKFIESKSQQDQQNLVDFIFTVMLNSDKAMRMQLDNLKQ